MKNNQCKAARALLGWSQPDLARESKAALRTIKNFESGKVEPQKLTLLALIGAFERHGLVMLKTGGVDYLASAHEGGSDR
ncbi:helix-turn-helix transcriptional regulator [Pseudomonas proteolytica]|uniref:helix-turn-helix transcriptional regulator n=1 Tax=Pseudomonas proteolytica TaxID=219574 RepID=UPI0014754C69|nr:helix-turn-helix transcriptional regulator [Pseudomonas proteolytica]NMZ14659.1 helix-turn-helix transcriptional regulator [Pseudomonas proteolytica]